VDELVTQFLEHQSLKILPQAPFGDAVNQYVAKDDKHAMEEFVKDTLTEQVKQMLSLDDGEEDLDDQMTKNKMQIEQQFKAGLLKRRKGTIKPKPADWDSDMDGHWEGQPGVVAYDAPEEPVQPPTKGAKGSPTKTTQAIEDDDEDMGDVIEEEEEPAPKPRGRGRAAAAKATAPAKAPAKASMKKPPAKAASKVRGRKAVFDEASDDDEVVMDDDEPPAPPKRTTATRSQPARSQPSRAAASQSQARMKQSTINFSQKAAKTSQAVEISDDEISDDDDPFEAIPTKRTTRKR
jgi:double-strand break repair protein MRE11